MADDYKIMKVWHKERQAEMWIKDFAFNPEIHKKLSELFPKDHIYTVQMEALNAKLKKSLESEQKPVHSEPVQQETAETPDYEKMKMPDLRALAKSLGIKTQFTDKKTDILAKIKDTNATNP